MDYSELVRAYEKLEATAKKLEKRDILAGFFLNTKGGNLYKAVHLSMGVVPTGEAEIGVAEKMVIKIIEHAYGADEKEITGKFKELGDLGSAAEYFAGYRKQRLLGKKNLTIDLVFDNIQKLFILRLKWFPFFIKFYWHHSIRLHCESNFLLCH